MNLTFISGLLCGAFLAHAVPILVRRLLRGAYRFRRRHWLAPDDTDLAGA